jgi:hypothetical protein
MRQRASLFAKIARTLLDKKDAQRAADILGEAEQAVGKAGDGEEKAYALLLTYAALAQQANSRGAVQLHFRVQATVLGEDEGQLSQHLMELEEVGLIQVSRGNVSQEDIRVFFPHHPWMTGLEQRVIRVTRAGFFLWLFRRVKCKRVAT